MISKRGVHLIVAVSVCKAHFQTYPYFTHFNDAFSIDRNSVFSLKSQALNADKFFYRYIS